MASDLGRTLNNQLLTLDREYGAAVLSFDLLSALTETLEAYEGDRSHFKILDELLVLYLLLLNCRPRMANLILHLKKAILFMREHEEAGVPELREFLLGQYQDKEMVRDKVVDVAVRLMREDMRLLLHSYSSTIISVLERSAKNGVRPKVVVAGQEPEKTHRLVRFLREAGYDFSVVSEYSISHIVRDLDMAIFGALTLDPNEQLIMGPGSAGLVSLLRKFGVDTYVTLSTYKFSFWDQETAQAFKETRQKSHQGLDYEKHVFSHDIVSLDMFSGVVTETDVYNPKQTRELFAELKEQFLTDRALVRGLMKERGIE